MKSKIGKRLLGGLLAIAVMMPGAQSLCYAAPTQSEQTAANLALSGTPIVSVTEPKGSGSKDINVMRDGKKPDADPGGDTKLQYDTYTGNNDPHEDYFGYTFDSEKTFGSVIFQEGCHFDDGGWFEDIRVEVLRDDVWTEVENIQVSPAYPECDENNTRVPFGLNFETYTFTFAPATGTGIRMIGHVKGFANVAELEVYPYVEIPAGDGRDANLVDRISGSWVGQMAGVTWGAPTEFRYAGIIPDDEVPAWQPSMINGAFGQDDLYVEIPFMDALIDNGVDCDIRKVADAFRDSTFNLFHANFYARVNLRNGINAPDSGSYQYNQHCEDIDWQIESDFLGTACPGLVNEAIAKAFTLGHITNYGDGVYGGVFVSAMHARAFTAKNVDEIIEAGRLAIPEGSLFREVVEDTLAWHGEGKTWQETWQLLENKWGRTGRCPEHGGGTAIDAKLNAAYVLIGLLYGNGDFEQSMKISMQCGKDSDCNPSTVGSILGTYLGVSGIPEKFKSAADYTGAKFSCTDYTLNDAIDRNYRLAEKMLAKHQIEPVNSVYPLPESEEIVPAPLEQWPNMPSAMIYASMSNFDATVWVNAFDKTGIKSYSWDFGDGKTGSGQRAQHTYEEEGVYTVKCTITNNEDVSTTVSTKVNAFNNIARKGTPIIAAPNPPQGMGSRDIGIIADGVMPGSDGQMDQQYDTWGAWGDRSPHDEYVGYTFDREYTFQKLLFQEGGHFADGGWFANGSLKVQVRQDGEWVDVVSTVTPEYPNSDTTVDFGANFEVFTFTFDDMKGDGIRIYGAAGGAAKYISIAELQVFAKPEPISYQVMYVDRDGGKELLPTVTKQGVIDGIVHETAPAIDGYTPEQTHASLTLSENADQNILRFVYTNNTAAGRTALQSLITECELLQKADYTDETWRTFAKALSDAKAYLEAGELTRQGLEEKTKLLEEAKNQLQASQPNPKPPVAKKNGWKFENSAWYLYENDIKLLGWQSADGRRYYLDQSSGALKTGWYKVGSKWYFSESSGAMVTGWKKLGKWFYFGSDGAMKTGWYKVGSKWYFSESSGAMVTGWKKLGKWFYFGSDGAMKIGWYKVGSKWYFSESSGAMATGWKKLGKWFYFGSDGVMKIGWVQSGGKWYYLDTSGRMVVSSSRKINRKLYRFSASGICLNP